MDSIIGIAVKGFKSLTSEQSIDLKPLTILAGANSSGKSSIMQPLLLIKQTLESANDPGALLLDGPNVSFSSSDQLLSRVRVAPCCESFSLTVTTSGNSSLKTVYSVDKEHGIDISEMVYSHKNISFSITRNMSHEDIFKILPKHIKSFSSSLKSSKFKWIVERDRCYLWFRMLENTRDSSEEFASITISPAIDFIESIKSVIHLPGLRGNPRRAYPKTATSGSFSGSFGDYVASLVFQWQQSDKDKLIELGKMMELLGLTWKVRAKALNETRVELQVGRLPHSKRGGSYDLVNIADVGFGVSQVIPVLVALIAAKKGQLVYLEQPEIHLHPNAQRQLAHALCAASNRGVYVVVETHSAILLREVLTQIALGTLSPGKVKLHWFQRDDNGSTYITTANVKKNGSVGEWPQDFDSIELAAEMAFLDAVESIK